MWMTDVELEEAALHSGTSSSCGNIREKYSRYRGLNARDRTVSRDDDARPRTAPEGRPVSLLHRATTRHHSFNDYCSLKDEIYRKRWVEQVEYSDSSMRKGRHTDMSIAAKLINKAPRAFMVSW
uniref:Uncharacterized protein n=1 Tax=Oryza punctata TaxID=4537 RepID=A0A0E0KBZ9_ORYPU